jgi:hypothetical protein
MKVFAALAMLAALAARVASAGSITVDGRFSPMRTLQGPNYSIDASLGKQP